MTEFKLLGEFVTHCSRCKLDLNHRITLLNGDVPKRVLCLTCNGEHAYRAPGIGAKRATVTRTLTSKELAKVRLDHEGEQWRAKLEDKSKTPTPYSVTMECLLDDHIYHPTFGLGIVVGFVEPEKVQIFFDGEVKLLKGKHVPVPVSEKKRKRAFG